MESKGYYDEKSWGELKDLSQSASDRANNLRVIMKRLGISLLREPEKVKEVPNHAEAETEEDIGVTHPDHEGGNENDIQPGENSVAHDLDETPSESEAETQGGELSGETEAEPDQIQPLRRSTRIKKPSVWTNTRIKKPSCCQLGVGSTADGCEEYLSTRVGR